MRLGIDLYGKTSFSRFASALTFHYICNIYYNQAGRPRDDTVTHRQTNLHCNNSRHNCRINNILHRQQ